MEKLLNTLRHAKPGDYFAIVSENMDSEILNNIHQMLQDSAVLNPSKRNRTDLVHLSIESPPDRFSGLGTFCKAIYTAAGLTDQFEGLLLLDVHDIVATCPLNKQRLLALAEAIAIWGPRAITVLYGIHPKDTTVYEALELLDLSGNLQILQYTKAKTPVSIDLDAELSLGMYTCRSSTKQLLSKCIHEVCMVDGFSAERYLAALADKKRCISKDSVVSMREDPFSYHNRLLKKKDRTLQSYRRMGF